MCRGDGGSEAAKSSCRACRGTGSFGFPVARSPIGLGRHEIRQAVDRRKIEMVWYKAGAPAGLAGGAVHHHCSGGALNSNLRLAMTQTTNRLFDEMARLMNDAAGVASGVRREFETVFRNQADRILRDLDVVKREEFEAVKEMARLAREETEALKARVAALEAKLGSGGNR
jgi:BMFP domain-containing protein YqiC